ncbi:MAG: hypothetical protein LBS39_00340, partial [Campylobacteraceae bacterium]|nr:hypothetical protein [Campylobacteraceae bacterium]
LQTQSSITLEQISKRLQYRIKDSTVARKTEAGGDTIRYLGNSEVDETFNIIEWIGYSNEALRTGETPGWSGFIDLDNVDTNRAALKLATPGSDLSDAADIMNALSNNKVGLTAGTTAALVFKNKKGNEPDTGYGWDGLGGKAEYMLKVSRNADDVLQINGDAPDQIYEHYYLAHSAYAIVPNAAGGSDIDFNLELRYNYRPWIRETYESAETKSALLATHVNLFRIKQVGSTIRLKLCLHDGKKSGFDNYVVACKEEVIL